MPNAQYVPGTHTRINVNGHGNNPYVNVCEVLLDLLRERRYELGDEVDKYLTPTSLNPDMAVYYSGRREELSFVIQHLREILYRPK